MKKIIIYIAILLFISCHLAKSQIAVIANKSVTDSTVNISRLLEIYTLNTQFWFDGQKIKVFDLRKENNIINKFYSSLGISVMDILIIWSKKQYVGRTIPELLDNEDEMLKKVTSTPNSIGYVNLSKVTGEVKLLYTIQ